MNIRSIIISDYSKLHTFWQMNYFVNELDEPTNFKLFLEKNPNLSFLVLKNKKIIGTVLGSFDGRRGYIQKLVVAKNYRKKGIGKNLVKKVVEALKKAGALYIPINSESELVSFYEKCGFKKTAQIPLSISYSTYKK